MQLPRKMSAHNVMASISRTLGNREQKANAANEVRFAGEERKDKLYEPKHKQKLVRVLTVVAYVIFVSMAAILLSLYYTFLWDPKDLSVKMRIRPECPIVKQQRNSPSLPVVPVPADTTLGRIENDTQPEKTTARAAVMEKIEEHPAKENSTWNTLTMLTRITETESSTTTVSSSSSSSSFVTTFDHAKTPKTAEGET